MYKVTYKVGRIDVTYGRYSDRQKAELVSQKLYSSDKIQARVVEEVDGALKLKAVFPTEEGLFLEIDSLPTFEIGQPFKYNSKSCVITGIVAKQEPSGVVVRNWTMR